MAKRHKLRAKRMREALRAILGNCCSIYGCEFTDLEFDCIIPQGDEHHKMDSCRRNTFYWRQYKLDNLQLLCTYHHGEKSQTEQPSRKKPFWYIPDPF